MNATIQILLLVVLTMINAFFAASEMAFVSIKKSRVVQLKKEGVKGARTLLDLLQNPNKFLSTIQVGITLAGFFASASAASNFADDGERILASIGMPYAKEISFILITIILSYFTLVFGELFPKNVALRYKEKIALSSAKVISLISFIATPFVWLLAISTQFLMRLFKIPMNESEEPVTREALRKLVNVGRKQGNIDEDEEFLIRRVIDLDEIYVREIMIPREEVFAVDIKDWTEESIRDIIQSGYSRIPFYCGELDKIKGLLLLKDLLKAKFNSDEPITPEPLLRKMEIISDHRRVDDVLRYFQKKKIHMALVVDEYGIVKGMVTIEDILEEIVGEIDDEFDAPSHQIQEVKGGYRVKGNMSLHNINRYFELDLTSDMHDTLNGYLHEHYEIEMLREGHKLSLQGFLFTIEKRTDRKIESILIEVASVDSECN